jgi:hypothetical protein
MSNMLGDDVYGVGGKPLRRANKEAESKVASTAANTPTFKTKAM